jgi:predicted dehydrogenase
VATFRVLLMGLGTIATTHYQVLTALPGVEIIGGVDPASDSAAHWQARFPVHHSLDEALNAGLKPQLVVIATPTESHVRLVADVLSKSDALVLSEKPLTCDSLEIAQLVELFGRQQLESRLKVAHHFAFSPEVEWAKSVVEGKPGLMYPTKILSVFNDQYMRLPTAQLQGYVSSWIDSAPNQLSVLNSFATGWKVTSHASRPDRSVTELDHNGGTTVLCSNWVAGDTSKQTTIEFCDGESAIRIDHTSMTALAFDSGVVTQHLGYVGVAARKVAHYQGVYRALLNDPGDQRLSVGLAEKIAEVLAASAPVEGTKRVIWAQTPD